MIRTAPNACSRTLHLIGNPVTCAENLRQFVGFCDVRGFADPARTHECRFTPSERLGTGLTRTAGGAEQRQPAAPPLNLRRADSTLGGTAWCRPVAITTADASHRLHRPTSGNFRSVYDERAPK